MDTLDSLWAIHKKLVKMLVDTEDESVNAELLDVLADLGGVIANEMKRTGVKYIG